MTVRKRTLRIGLVVAAAGAFLAVPGINASAHATLSGPPWTVGVSNSTINNGWRDEMVCSIRAELHQSGKAKSDVQQTNGDTAGQISQIKNMISKGDQAIIIDPNSTTALNPTISQAASRGIKVVVVDQTLEHLRRASGREQPARLWASRHAVAGQPTPPQGQHRAPPGHQGRSREHRARAGQQDVLKHNPNIHVVATRIHQLGLRPRAASR